MIYSEILVQQWFAKTCPALFGIYLAIDCFCKIFKAPNKFGAPMGAFCTRIFQRKKF